MTTLAQHLANLNAEKLAWVAEDPDNRWTGLWVEDLAHWHEMGVYTVAQFKRYDNETMFWEMYKEVFGCRPRHVNLKDMSDEEYGPTAHDYVVFYCNAYSYDNATKRAVKHFKKLPHWPMIGGLHNVYCQLANSKE